MWYNTYNICIRMCVSVRIISHCKDIRCVMKMVVLEVGRVMGRRYVYITHEFCLHSRR